MGLSVKQGTITAKTGTTGAVGYTGIGFVPKLLILYATAETAEGFLNGTSLGFGAASGTGALQRAAAFAADDGATGSVTGRRHSQNVITILSAGAPTIGCEAALTTFDADGFTLTYSTVHATNAYIIHYLAIGGTDLTAVKVGEFVLPTGTDSNYEVTDPAFTPDCVLLFGVADDAALGTTGVSQGTLCFGAATSSSARWCSTIRNRDNVATTELSSYQRSALCYAELLTNGSVRAEADLVGFTASGFDLNVSTAPAAADRVFYVALKGAQVAVGVDTIRTTTGTKQTALAFPPSAVMLVSYGQTASATPLTAVFTARMSVGSGTSATARGNVAVGSADAAGTTDEASSTVTTRVFRGVTPAAGAGDDVDITTLDVNGFTLDTLATAGFAREFGYLAVGAAPVAAGGSLVFPRRDRAIVPAI